LHREVIGKKRKQEKGKMKSVSSLGERLLPLSNNVGLPKANNTFHVSGRLQCPVVTTEAKG
jgi:hypothetical protein